MPSVTGVVALSFPREFEVSTDGPNLREMVTKALPLNLIERTLIVTTSGAECLQLGAECLQLGAECLQLERTLIVTTHRLWSKRKPESVSR